MGEIWTDESKFKKILEVEKASAKVQASLKIIPKRAALEICKKARFEIKDILKREKVTRHDIVAFIDCLAKNVGSPHNRYIHYGLTSSDVIDTGLSLQIKEADKVLRRSFKKLEKALLKKIYKHKNTLCAGRTHGMHAEPISFSLKLSHFLAEFYRAIKRYDEAIKESLIGKLSGPVGTYSLQSEKVEKKVCSLLKLKPETIATQVIPRDRHAALIFSLSMIGNFLERLSIELRHLQRTEVGEVTEGFSKDQKGSSAMPHKKNPISAENISGLSRLLRSYQVASMENGALWHERDISHSSVERVIFPDAFILTEYALHRMAHLLENLNVNKERMLENMKLSHGKLYSSLFLVNLVSRGMSRKEAYEILQTLSHGREKKKSLQSGKTAEQYETNLKDTHLKSKLLQSKRVLEFLNPKDIHDIFSGRQHKKMMNQLLKNLMKRKFL